MKNLWQKKLARGTAGVLFAMSLTLTTSCTPGEGSSPLAESTGSTKWPGAVWSPENPRYSSKVERQVEIAMSDGVVLRADVAYPTDPSTGDRMQGEFPVILTQTPYLDTDPQAGDYFVERGYVYVTAYVRGTTTSGGAFEFFSERDAQDGVELVEWAAKDLAGSNGVVGLHGDSYAGINQMFTVARAGSNSAIKAMSASCMGAEFYRETYFAGGIPTQTLNFQRVIGEAMGEGTASSGKSLVRDIESGGDRAYYGDFWRERTVGELAQQIADADVPTLLWSSDGDIYAQSSLELYSYLQNAHAGDPVHGSMSRSTDPSGRYQIIMSQGGHCENQDPAVELEWFDTWLKGFDTRMEETANPIHVREMGSNKWINTSHYPVVPEYTQYYLNVDDKDNVMQKELPSEASDVLVETTGEEEVQFDTPVFTDGARLAGPISASIYATPSSKDFSLVATLQVVHSDGTVTPLTSGALLGSMAALDDARTWHDDAGVTVRPYGTFDKSTTLTPGSTGRYEVSISPRFAQLPPGSKLRLLVSSKTEADCSPVLGTDPCFPTRPQSANLKDADFALQSGGSTPSSLNLPLLNFECWADTGSSSESTPFWGGDSEVRAASDPCQSGATGGN